MALSPFLGRNDKCNITTKIEMKAGACDKLVRGLNHAKLPLIEWEENLKDQLPVITNS